MNEITKEIDKQWKKIKKKKNVVGYSRKLQLKTTKGVADPERLCLRIYVEKKFPIEALKTKDLVSRIIQLGKQHYPTDIVEIGKMEALSNKERLRPICAGISTMHFGFPDDTACTLNGFFEDLETGEILQASNEHCYGREGNAKKGDLIIQPGPSDGGTEEDMTGRFIKRVNIKFTEFQCPYRNFLYRFWKLIPRDLANKVDIAFATIVVPYEVIATYVGKIKAKTIFKETDKVTKTGRTTEQTFGEVIDTNYSGEVQYSRGLVSFSDCYLIEGDKFSQGGDSGSPVFNVKNEYGGALFAGSDTHTMVCKIDNIEQEANVRLLLSSEN